MIISKLQGGLGNQMFQYATARGISRVKENVIIDTSFFSVHNKSSETFTARDYELKLFKNIQAEIASNFLLNVLHNQQLQYKVFRKLFYNNIKRVTQEENEYIPSLKELKGAVYLDGYFQSEKYFGHIRRELLHEFEFPQLDSENLHQLKKIHSYPNPVSIHVRRGDYLKSNILQIHGILPLSYYKQSIEIIESTVSNPHYFIFSNDVDWCETNFSFLEGNVTVIKGNNSVDAWKDMYLMTQCKHHIIANSSFSWWGAWLSKEQGGIHLAPYRWFNPEAVKFDIHDFIPSSWQVVYYG